MFSSLMLKDQNPLLQNSNLKPKCSINNPNFDTYSTETDTPQNEKSGPKSFVFPQGSLSSDEIFDPSESSGSKRNSITKEERPLITHPLDLSQLMLCHFG